jgi:hypothetical protein
MTDAHQPHQPSRHNPALWCCKGPADPITGHFCQWRGSARQQFEHLVERVEAMLQRQET